MNIFDLFRTKEKEPVVEITDSLEFLQDRMKNVPEGAKYSMLGHMIVLLLKLRKENEELKN